MGDIRRSLHPCVTQDYLRRTLSSSFQFVLGPAPCAAGIPHSTSWPSIEGISEAKYSFDPTVPFLVIIPLYPKPKPHPHCSDSNTSTSTLDRFKGDPSASSSRHNHLTFTPTAPRHSDTYEPVLETSSISRSVSAPVLDLGDAYNNDWGGTDSKERNTIRICDLCDDANTDSDTDIGPLSRFVSPPLIAELLFTLYAADDRVTSYNTQFLKALYMARVELSMRYDILLKLRECTRVRGLRAR